MSIAYPELVSEMAKRRITRTRISDSLAYIDAMVKLCAAAYPNNGTGVLVPMPSESSYLGRRDDAIKANMPGSSASWTLQYILMEYTKTTDTATIAIPTATEMTATYEEGVQSA